MIRFLLALSMALNTPYAFGAAKITNADVKTLAQVTAAGGTAANLINDTKIYVTANSINQQLSGAITAGLLGGGSGINLVGNPSFEAGGVTGWSTFSSTLTGTLPSTAPAACSSCSITIAADTTTPLRQASSLKVASTGVWSAGQGFISTAFTVPPAFQGKTLGLSGLYKVLTGMSNLALTGLSTSTMAVALYDVTNAAWVQPSGSFNFIQGSGVGSIAGGAVSIPSNTTSMQIAVFALNASGGAASIDFDDIGLGPINTNAAQFGPVGEIIATGSITPPSGFLLANGAAVSRSTYSDLFTAIGTTYGVGDGSTTFNLPNMQGVFARGAGTQSLNSIGYTGTLGAANNDTFQGHYHSFRINGAYVYQGSSSGSGANNINNTNAGNNGQLMSVQEAITDGAHGTPRIASETAPASVGVAYHIRYLKSANMSSDLPNVPVVLSINNNTPSGTPTGSGNISFGAATVDTASGWNGSTTYTFQVAGVYEAAAGSVIGTPTSTGGMVFSIAINATSGTVCNGSQAFVSSENRLGASCSGSFTAKVGDTLTVAFSQSNMPSPGWQTGNTYLNIKRVLGVPQAVQANDTVSASAHYSATQSFTTGVGATMIPDVKDYDKGGSGSNYSTSTGLFTAPVSGLYAVTGFINLTGATVNNGAMIMSLIYNGVASTRLARTGISNDTGSGLNGTTNIYMKSGDTIGVQFFQNNGATRTNESGVGYVQFTRLAN